jgi:hypothetical protein
MVFDDVRDLTIDLVEAHSWPDSASALSLIQTREAVIRGCRHGKAGSFLSISGEKSNNIVLTGNVAGDGEIETTIEVGKDAVIIK